MVRLVLHILDWKKLMWRANEESEGGKPMWSAGVK